MFFFIKQKSAYELRISDWSADVCSSDLDDALIGSKSSALRMGRYVRPGVGAFSAAALLLWSGAIWQIRPQGLAVLALLPVALQLMWQVGTLKENGLDPLVKFRSNRFAGLLMFLGCLVVGDRKSTRLNYSH